MPDPGLRAAGELASARVRCRDLRVEQQVAPLGLGTAHPRFSWRFDGEPGEWPVTAELEVLDASGSLLWSAEAGTAGERGLIEYAGAPLASDRAYRWRVRIRARDAGAPDGTAEQPSEWAESSFGTGLLDPADWTAAWVAAPLDVAGTHAPAGPPIPERWSMLDWIGGRGPQTDPAERLRPVVLLRQRFRVGDGLVRACLYATAHGVYAAEVNGRQAGDQVLAPGFDSYEHRVSAQCYDVTALMEPGENALGLVLADGWWAGRIGLTGSSAQWGTRPSAIWQLHLHYDDGRTEVRGSGRDAVCSEGPWRYSDLFVGELFDRRSAFPGWSRAGFDDAGWVPAEPTGEPVSTIVPFEGEPVRRVLELPAARVTGDGAGGAIVDFGQVIAGRIRLRLTGLRAGQRVTIEHTETLDADGTWFDNIVGINKDQRDVYVVAGLPGGEVYEPAFTFHGFRYARIRGLGRLPGPDEVTAVVLSSDLEATGSFRSSDARLNRLHENVVRSQRANFLSIPTDCPQRERAGWTGDIQVFAEASANNMQVQAFLTRWLRNLRADQLEDGRIPIFSPRSPFDREAAASAGGIGGIVAAAGWSDAIAIVPWTLYERYGDVRVLEENYGAILRWAEYQRREAAAGLPESLQGRALSGRRRAVQGLLYNTGLHFGDWLAPSTLRGAPFHEAILRAPELTGELIAPMFQARTLTLASRIAGVLGRASDAAELGRRAADVRMAFAEEYVSADGGLPVDLQGVYVLALALEMVPAGLRSRTAARLAEMVERNSARLDTGFLSVPYLLDVLWDAGYRALARRVLWQDESPSWLYQVDRGATTVWESWDAIGRDGSVRPVSLNHYAFGCVDDWLYRRVAGLQRTAPAYRSVRIEPDFDAGVDGADAWLETPQGRIEVAWTRHGETADLRVRIPGGVRAELVTPAGIEALPAGVTRLRRSVEPAAG